MKKFFTVAVCAILSVFAIAQTYNMQIKLKSGETIDYKTTDVEKVTFEEESTPPVPPQGVFEVEFDLQDLTSTSCKLKITPSNDTRYYAYIWVRDFMQNQQGGLLSDRQILDTCIPDPEFDNKCYTGETVLTLENAIPGSQFVAVVFDAKAKDGETVKVYPYAIKLNEGLSSEPQFEITDQVIGFEDVSFHAKAKDPNGFVIARVLQKSYFESHGETVMQNLYFMLHNASVDKLINLSDYVKENGAYGECDFYFDNLVPGTEYVAAVFYVDPTNDDQTKILDWNYTRWDFTTKTPTTAPTLELTNAKKTRNNDGTINISFHAKATNAARARFGAKRESEMLYGEAFDKASDIWFGFKQMSASDLDLLNSPEGIDIYVPNFELDDEWYVVMRVTDEQGGNKSCSAKLEF